MSTAIKISCKHCNQHIQCDDTYAGRQILCPQCQNLIPVPQAASSPSLRLSEKDEPTYMVMRGETQYGPYTLQVLKDYLAADTLKYDDMAWREGMRDWQPLRGIVPPPGFSSVPPQAVKRTQSTGGSSTNSVQAGMIGAVLAGGYNTYLFSYNYFWAIKTSDTKLWMCAQAVFAAACFVTVIWQFGRSKSASNGVLLVLTGLVIGTCVGYKLIDAEAADLIKYERAVSRLAAAEAIAIQPLVRFYGASDKNRSYEQLHKILRDSVIPSYMAFLTQLEAIQPSTVEVQSLHGLYVNGAHAQLEGWHQMLLSIQYDDAQMLANAKEAQESGANQIQTFQRALRATEVKHKLADGKQ